MRRIELSAIEEYYRARLRTIFAGVANNTVRLKNSKNSPLYLLFFVAGNKNGASHRSQDRRIHHEAKAQQRWFIRRVGEADRNLGIQP